MDIVKKNLKAIVAGFLGVFHFILMALPFAGVYAEGMGQSETKNISGYKCLGDAVSGMDAAVLLKIALIVFLLAGIAMLLIGLYLLLDAFMGDKINLPFKLDAKLRDWIHMGYAGASVLVLLAGIIVSIANKQTESFMGISVSAGVSIGAGTIFGVLLAVGSFVGLWFVEKKGLMDAIDFGALGARFACAQCGAPAKKGSAFCSKCGGQVVEIAITKPMCTACGAPAKKGEAFCSKCGGKVEEVVPTKPVCENCGAPAKGGAAFCPLCGGKIVQK